MNKGFALSWMLAAAVLACTGSLAQQRLSWGGIPVASECGQIAANSTLLEIRQRVRQQGPHAAKAPQQLEEFAQVLSRDRQFLDSLRCFQTLTLSPTGR